MGRVVDHSCPPGSKARLFLGATARSGPEPPRYRGFYITLSQTTVGRSPLDE